MEINNTLEIVDCLQNKWIIVKNGAFGKSYFAQRANASGKLDESPFVAHVVSISFV